MSPSTLFFQLFHSPLLEKKDWRTLAHQIYFLGVKSLPLVIVTAIATGMVMTLQFGTGLSRFGGLLYVPRLVTVSVLREMGPVFASLMMAARIGAGVTAELGSMKVTQQIDAFWALGTSPFKKVLLPRIYAILVVVPILCVFANIISIMGIFFISTLSFNMDPAFVWSKVFEGFSLANFSSGFFKSFFFAFFIAFSACYFGINTQGGSDQVGHATTRSVVTASIGVLVGDFALTKIFLWL